VIIKVKSGKGIQSLLASISNGHGVIPTKDADFPQRGKSAPRPRFALLSVPSRSHARLAAEGFHPGLLLPHEIFSLFRQDLHKVSLSLFQVCLITNLEMLSNLIVDLGSKIYN